MTKPRRKLPPLPPGGYDPTGRIELPPGVAQPDPPSTRWALPAGTVYTAPVGASPSDHAHVWQDAMQWAVAAIETAQPVPNRVIVSNAGQGWFNRGTATMGIPMTVDSEEVWAILTGTHRWTVRQGAARPPLDHLGYAVLFPRDPLADLAWERFFADDYTGPADDAERAHRQRDADFAGDADGVVAACRRELRRYTYRPGVTMEVGDHGGFAYAPHVGIKLVVSHEGGLWREVQTREVTLNLNDTPEQRRDKFGSSLFTTLHTLERHVVGRRLMVDGLPYTKGER